MRQGDGGRAHVKRAAWQAAAETRTFSTQSLKLTLEALSSARSSDTDSASKPSVDAMRRHYWVRASRRGDPQQQTASSQAQRGAAHERAARTAASALLDTTKAWPRAEEAGVLERGVGVETENAEKRSAPPAMSDDYVERELRSLPTDDVRVPRLACSPAAWPAC